MEACTLGSASAALRQNAGAVESPVRPLHWRVVWGALALVALLHVVSTLKTLRAPDVYRKDLLQDYLAARAILDGSDPYVSMGALRARYLPKQDRALAFPHPTPHPPPALLLTLPLGLTAYPWAAVAWLVFGYGLLGCSIVLVVRATNSRSHGVPVDLTPPLNPLPAGSASNSPPWEGGVGGVGRQRTSPADSIVPQSLSAGARLAAQLRTSDGLCPPPLPPLPKGGSYQAPPLPNGVPLSDAVHNPNADRSRSTSTRLDGRWPLGIAVLGLASCPIFDDLLLGQFSLVTLALVSGSYFALKRQRGLLCGALLGAAVALKFLFIPAVVYSLWKRQWSVVLAASVMIVALHAACLGIMPGAVGKYYTEIAPHANSGYSASDRNISLWTVGQRVFGGLYSQATINSIKAPALIPAPGLARVCGAAVAVFTFIAALRYASKSIDVGDGFLAMLALSTVFNPIAWEIYLVVLLLPLTVVARRLARGDWPLRATAAWTALVLLLVFLKVPRDLCFSDSREATVSALKGMLSALPMLLPLATCALLLDFNAGKKPSSVVSDPRF